MRTKVWIGIGIVAVLVMAGAAWFVLRSLILVDPTGARLFWIRTTDFSVGGNIGEQPRKVTHLMGTDRITWDSKRREIDLGFCFHKPHLKRLWGNPTEDYSRYATTYFHRLGPIGRVMERWNWFSGPNNTYAADARLPAALVASTAPLSMLVASWSEPPVAVIGLEAGTMASYARPYQHFHFFEEFPVICDFSFPRGGKEAAFTFVPDAKKRGANVVLFRGKPRKMLQAPYRSLEMDNTVSGAPGNFYHLIVLTAFYTQEIPTELLTREAMHLYFRKLTPKGILCIHVSNRYFDVAKALAATAESVTLPDPANPDDSIPLACVRGRDLAPDNQASQGGSPHYSSEWVLIARDRSLLTSLSMPPDYEENMARFLPSSSEPYWDSAIAEPRFTWTDASADVNAIRRPK